MKDERKENQYEDVAELTMAKGTRCSVLWDPPVGLLTGTSVLSQTFVQLSFMKTLLKCLMTFIFQFPNNDLLPSVASSESHQ